jgi:solute carrier family 8 (sodium/calcium exchanger)
LCACRIISKRNLCLDTFASKVAAIEDDTADASVGNVTGSNAVNVFLGMIIV